MSQGDPGLLCVAAELRYVLKASVRRPDDDEAVDTPSVKMLASGRR